ncbi:MAG: Bro-N domain-containing protein [Bacillota bacterium]|nr:Bro-N domain-containing protein [Bacillota bacterium]
MKNELKLFEDNKIRTAWDEEHEEWYFSVVDVCGILSNTENPRRYWSDLKRKLKSEGATEVYEKIVQLKMTAPDGKQRLTDVADTKQLLRIIQSIPSPKAEPFKLWLAEVSTTEISRNTNPKGFEASRDVARQGGNVARNAREEIESHSGKSVLSSANAKTIKEIE